MGLLYLRTCEKRSARCKPALAPGVTVAAPSIKSMRQGGEGLVVEAMQQVERFSADIGRLKKQPCV